MEIEVLEKWLDKAIKLKRKRDDDEIKRLITQYDHHNYGQKFKVDIDIVIGALMGSKECER